MRVNYIVQKIHTSNKFCIFQSIHTKEGDKVHYLIVNYSKLIDLIRICGVSGGT